MGKRFLLLSIVVFSLFNANATASAGAAEKKRARMMERQLNKLLARRSDTMEEEMKTLSRKEEIPRFLLNSSYRNFFPPAGGPEENNNNPKFFSIQNTRNALNFNFESEIEDRQIASSPLPAHRSRLLFEENLETGFKGSIYHPNLVAFDVNLENGLTQNRERFQPNLSGKLKNSPLNYFHTLFSFLNKKPYAFSLLADKSREVQNREFFERQVINSTRYGGNFRLRNEFAPLGFTFYNTDKTIDRQTRPSQNFSDEELNLTASNQSMLGETFFDATQDKFSREEDFSDQKGTSRNLNLTNHKYFSEDNRKSLYSSFHLYDLTGTSKSKSLNLNENLNINHTDYLDSSYTYNFSDKSSGGLKTRDNRASASLIHRLYESLTSSLAPYYFNSSGTNFSRDSYGVSWNEDYIKKLGRIGRFSSGFGIDYSKDRRRSINSVISVIDEALTLKTGTVTFLDKPRVDTVTVVVTNSAGNFIYTLNIDYELISVGELTQIQRIPGGGISDSDHVLVDYQAQDEPSLKYDSLNETFYTRMDFLEDLIGIYYRLSRERHPNVSNDHDIILQTLDATTVGLDFNYKNLNVNVENEDYDSSLSPYRQWKYRESVFFNPLEKSTLTFEFSQSILRLISVEETHRYFHYISRYTIGLSRYAHLNLEAGYRRQEGEGINLDDFTAGSSYDLNLNEFFMSLRYEFKRQLYLGDRWKNHFFSLSIKRTF